MSRLAISLAVCLFVFSSAHADPLILSGSVTGSSSPGPGLTFSFAGDGFSAHGGAAGSNSGIVVLATLVPFYRPGDSINLSLITVHILGWPDVFGGTLVIGGNSYNLLGDMNTTGHGHFSFTAMSTIPFTDEAMITLTAPFTMNGNLSSRDPSPASISFTGEGIATMVLFRNPDGSYRLQGNKGVRYDFSSTSTPEPTTMLLLATGLIGGGAALRKRSGTKT